MKTQKINDNPSGSGKLGRWSEGKRAEKAGVGMGSQVGGLLNACN